jgi:hypothetical protein
MAKLRLQANFAAVKHSFLHLPAVVLAATLVLLPACQRPEEPRPPANLIPREKLIPLLSDLHVLEAQVENARLSPDSARALYQAQQKDVLWRHSVSDSVLKNSVNYYLIHGKDLDEIYSAVIDTLARREANLPQ